MNNENHILNIDETDIIYMSEKEILETKFSFIFEIEPIEDMWKFIGYNTVGLIGKYNIFKEQVEKLYEKTNSFELMYEKGSYYSLTKKYVNSEYSAYYGESEIFTKQLYIDAILKNLPILLIDGDCVKYWNVINNDYTFKSFSNKKVAEHNINLNTRDIFYGTKKDLMKFIKTLKKR